MVEPEIVLEIALAMLNSEPRKLNALQFDAWKAHRYDGRNYRDAAAFLRREFHYDVSDSTVLAASRIAHDLITVACEDVEQGRVRFGNTVASGSESWFTQDRTAQDAARKTRVIVKKKCESRAITQFAY